MPRDAQQAVAAAVRELLERRPTNAADPVERALAIALVDKRVHDALVRYISQGEVFFGVGLLARAQEHVVLSFEFRRLPPEIAFFPPSIAARVNIDAGTVDLVVDPYRGEPLGPVTTSGELFPRGMPARNS